MVGSSTRDSSDSSFLRKLRKPLIEKKRRDRMNVSIDSLKALLAKSSNNPASIAKMDKAEILELAVSHISQLHQRPKTTHTGHVTSYLAGFRECRKETGRFLSSAAMMPNPVLLKLDNHLQNVCDTSGQDDVIMSSTTRKTRFNSERRCTSSPALDLPPAPTYGSFCPNSMFSPIASAEIRGLRVHSPMDSLYFGRAGSPFSMPSPGLSTGSSIASDSSISGFSDNVVDSSYELEIIAHAQSQQCKSDIILEAPWRPW